MSRTTMKLNCKNPEKAEQMAQLIQKVKSEGDTIWGIITCVIQGVPAGLGEPAFGKLQAELAEAMMTINAAKGFEYGLGFDAMHLKGSEQNDIFVPDDNGNIRTKTNHSGGIQGGISNGQDIYFRVAFKPVATILKDQQTVNKKGEIVTFKATGRHDPCVLPRAVPIVESMAAIIILDQYLLSLARSKYWI